MKNIIILPNLRDIAEERHWSMEIVGLIGDRYEIIEERPNHYKIIDDIGRPWSIPKDCAEVVVDKPAEVIIDKPRRIRWYHKGKLSEKMTFEKFISEQTIDDYINQVFLGDYEELTPELFDFISEEGWLLSIEDEFNQDYNIEDFEYLTLDLSEGDKMGLKNFDSSIVEKFSAFDLKLKSEQEYPFDTLDFIDYDKGIIYIIRLI